MSDDWYDVKAKPDKYDPRQGKPTQLSFDDDCALPEAAKVSREHDLKDEAANYGGSVRMGFDSCNATHLPTR